MKAGPHNSFLWWDLKCIGKLEKPVTIEMPQYRTWSYCCAVQVSHMLLWQGLSQTCLSNIAVAGREEEGAGVRPAPVGTGPPCWSGDCWTTTDFTALHANNGRYEQPLTYEDHELQRQISSPGNRDSPAVSIEITKRETEQNIMT